MARQARKPTARERERRTQERLRKKEIENVPTGGVGTLEFARFQHSTDYNPEHIGSDYFLAWDTIAEQSGGFSISGRAPGTGSGSPQHIIVPPDHGMYVAVLNIFGTAQFSVNVEQMRVQIGCEAARSAVDIGAVPCISMQDTFPDLMRSVALLNEVDPAIGVYFDMRAAVGQPGPGSADLVPTTLTLQGGTNTELLLYRVG